MNETNRQGMTLVLSGPSGSGKSSIFHGAMKQLTQLEFSVSCTTRSPREGEQNDVDYHFITPEEFRKKIAENAFAEYAEVHGNYYGTLKSELKSRMERGIDVLLDIDVQGAKQLRTLSAQDENFRHSCEFVFITPPSFEVLEQRLRARGTETEDVIQRRLKNAHTELAQWRSYDYIIINDDLNRAVSDFLSLVNTLRIACKRFNREPFHA